MLGARIVLTLISLSFIACPAIADMSQAAAEAKTLGDTMTNYLPTKVGDVPGYEGTNVPETKYNHNNMESAKFEVAAKDDTFNMIKESIEKRAPYEIDIINDPMFKHSNNILSEAEHAEEEEGNDETNKPTRHTCTRGREVYESKCRRILVPHQIGTKIETKEWIINLSRQRMYWNDWVALQPLDNLKKSYLGGPTTQTQLINTFKKVFRGIDEVTGEKIDIDPTTILSVNLKKIYGPSVPLINFEADHRGHTIVGPQYHQVSVLTKSTVPLFELVWEESCPELESLIDIGRCEVKSHQCVGGSQTKIIQGVPITAGCWEEEVTYQCHSDQINTCKALLEKGCIQISSVCKTKDGDECIEWEQTFECYGDKHSLAKSRLKWDDTPCLNGDCVDQSWEPNRDMADSLSKLAIFKEMQKDMDPNTQTVFKGQSLQCSRVIANAKNCCVQKG